MFEVVFLGTAAGVPSVERGLPALLVRHEGRRFLVDCGEGTQRQLLESGLGLRRLDDVLLTHGDVDHLLGVDRLGRTPRRRDGLVRRAGEAAVSKPQRR